LEISRGFFQKILKAEKKLKNPIKTYTHKLLSILEKYPKLFQEFLEEVLATVNHCASKQQDCYDWQAETTFCDKFLVFFEPY